MLVFSSLTPPTSSGMSASSARSALGGDADVLAVGPEDPCDGAGDGASVGLGSGVLGVALPQAASAMASTAPMAAVRVRFIPALRDAGAGYR
jgi:hypothetical protein